MVVVAMALAKLSLKNQRLTSKKMVHQLNFFCLLLVASSSLQAAEPAIKPIQNQGIMAGGCYMPPITASEKPLDHAVPIKAGLWRSALLDTEGKVDQDSVIETCSRQQDWRETMLESGSGEEGCEPTNLIEKKIGNKKSVGFKETCKQGSKIITRIGWLLPSINNQPPIKAYEMRTTLQVSTSKNVEVERSQHTWVGTCVDEGGKRIGH